MRTSSKTKFAVAGTLLTLAVLVPVATTLLAFLATPLYLSVCRIEVSPTSPSMFTAEFAAVVFGGDGSLRLVPGQGTALVSIEAVADSPQDAADRANGAVTKIQAALSRQQPTTVTVVDPAEAGLMPFRPNMPFHVGVGLGIGGAVGLAGIAMLFVAVRSRNRAGLEQYECA